MKLEAKFAVFSIIAIIIAWFVGIRIENADVFSTIKEKMPNVAKFEEIDKASYKIYGTNNKTLGYVTLESYMGYGGPLQVAVAVDSTGAIFDLEVIKSKETPSYLEKVLNAKFLDRVIGKSYNDEYAIGSGVDAISSATYTSKAIVEAAKKGNRYVASKMLGLKISEGKPPSIKFGILEITLLILFVLAYFAYQKNFKYRKQIRWGAMLGGLFILGFNYNQLFNLSMVNQLLLGYFPPLHSHLYWYLLIGGIFLMITVKNRNSYCDHFCPLGAAQECIGMIGGAKDSGLGKFRNIFKWSLRILVLCAIIIALLLRNPGVTSYEIFGTLFKLTGSNFQFAILAIVLIASMFIKKPWCRFLCPIGPVTGHLKSIRRTIKTQIDAKKKK